MTSLDQKGQESSSSCCPLSPLFYPVAFGEMMFAVTPAVTSLDCVILLTFVLLLVMSQLACPWPLAIYHHPEMMKVGQSEL